MSLYHDLSSSELKRYSRHLLLPAIGLKGQLQLKNASVLLVGAGGLGSASALYLAAGGIGKIGLVDFDFVDESNLQRQVIYGDSAVGKLKVEAALARLSDLNREIQIIAHPVRLTAENTMVILKDYDVIVDGSDNFPTRYLLNDACFFLKKPLVSASIDRFDAQIAVFNAPAGPCYRCLFPAPPPQGLTTSCAEAGVLGVLPGLAGALQANEVIKFILNLGETLQGQLLQFDTLSLQFRKLKLRKNPDCSLCGPNPTVKNLIDYEAFCNLKTATAREGDPVYEIAPLALKRMIDEQKKISLLDTREPHEKEIAENYGAEDISNFEFDLAIEKSRTGKYDRAHLSCWTQLASASAYFKKTGFCKRLQS